MSLAHIIGAIRKPVPTVVLPSTTWNPSDKDSLVTLSDSNKIYSQTGTWRGVRSVDFKASGLWYFEAFIGAATNYIDVGFANASASLGNYPGVDQNSVGLLNNGEVFRNGSLGSLVSSFSKGDIMCFALDLTNRKFWVRKNNGAWNNLQAGTQDPVTNQGGQALGTSMTGNVYCFGSASSTAFVTGKWIADDITYTPPTGFSVWDAGVPAATGLITSRNWRFNLITKLGSEMWWDETYFRFSSGSQQDAIDAASGIAFASAPQGSYPALGAFNDSLGGTTFAGIAGTLPQTLGFDFTIPRSIREVEIYCHSTGALHGVGQFTFQYYDGSTWQTIQSRNLVSGDYTGVGSNRYKFTVQ